MTAEVARYTRRERVVALTEAGTVLVRNGDKLTERTRAAISDAVAPDELPQVLRFLQALLRALES